MKEMMGDRSMHRAPNKDILDHTRKRQVEVELYTLRVELEDQGCVWM
jgi:hypothetical protein